MAVHQTLLELAVPHELRKVDLDATGMRSFSAAVLAGVLSMACGGASPPPSETPAPAVPVADPAKPRAAVADDGAAKAAAIEALTAAEAKSGTCDEGHKAALEKLLGDVESTLKARNGEDGKPLGLQLVGKRTVALGAGAKSIEMAVSGRGTEVHVLAFGAKQVSLDVLVGNAAATTLRSPLASGPTPLALPTVGTVDAQADSREVQIKPGQPIVVKLSGQGCVALISLLRP